MQLSYKINARNIWTKLPCLGMAHFMLLDSDAQLLSPLAMTGLLGVVVQSSLKGPTLSIP